MSMAQTEAGKYLEFYSNSEWLEMGAAEVQKHLDDMLAAATSHLVKGDKLNPEEILIFSDGSKLIIPNDAPAYTED